MLEAFSVQITALWTSTDLEGNGCFAVHLLASEYSYKSKTWETHVLLPVALCYLRHITK